MKRTQQQNKAMHKYFKLLSHTLNEAGLDMREVLKPGIDIPWTDDSVKRHLWHPIESAMFDQNSTADMETDEVGKVYEVLSRHLSEKFGVHVPFPDRIGPIENQKEEK